MLSNLLVLLQHGGTSFFGACHGALFTLESQTKVGLHGSIRSSEMLLGQGDSDKVKAEMAIWSSVWSGRKSRQEPGKKRTRTGMRRPDVPPPEANSGR